MSDKIKFSFIAALPAIQSAIKIDGQGGSARLQLDIPESELQSILRLQMLCGQSFKVTIERTNEENQNQSKVKYIK